MLLTFTYLMLLAFGGVSLTLTLIVPVVVLDVLFMMLIAAFLGVGDSSTRPDDFERKV